MNLILWWTYQRGEWWRGVITMRISFLGWVMLIMTGVCALFGTDVISNALGFICFLGAVVITVDFLSLFLKRAHFQVSFSGVHTGVVTVGQKLNLSFLIKSKKERHGVSFILYPWIEGISLSQFSNAREPRESSRNFIDRFLKFYRWSWLMKTRKTPFKATYSDEMTVKKGGSEVSLPVTFLQRGKWSLLNVRAHIPGVFGLFERSSKTAGKRGEVYVAPQVLPLSFLGGGGANELDALSLDTRPVSGDSQEFLSLREYRPGDSWRKMNWKAMARTDKAMIQESEQPGVLSYVVVWETDRSSEEEFELGASLLASMVSYFYSSGVKGKVIISHGGKKPFSWEVSMQDILYCLAEIKREHPWSDDEEVEIGTALIYTIRSEVGVCSFAGNDSSRELILKEDCVNGEKVEKEFFIP